VPIPKAQEHRSSAHAKRGRTRQGLSAEQIQLLAQDLKGQPMCLIVPGDKIDYGDITLLAVPMTAADALFDALWIPRQIIVDNGLAKLQIQSFCASFGAYKYLRTRAELVYEGKPHGDLAARPDPRRKAGALLLLPSGERFLRTYVIVHAAEQGDVFVAEASGEKQASQVLLGSDRLCKHDGLAAAATVPAEIKNHLDRFLERARLGIVRKRLRALQNPRRAHGFNQRRHARVEPDQ
jgi:hypothetical protein